MKIRMGFVSNSSSSSFCIYGVSIDKYNEKLEKEANVEGIEYYGGEDYAHFIGLSLTKIKDDETGKEFKERVKKSIEKLKLKGSPGIHQHSWYNG